MKPSHFALAAALLAAGCAAPAPQRKPLSMRQRTRLDQTFYKAVDAYMRADYADCRLLIEDILRVDPFDRDAVSLRRRVRAVERASSQP